MKRCVLFLLTFVFLSMFIVGVYAQKENVKVISEKSDVEDQFEEGVVLETDAGTTPDSALYFVDEFFDRFSSDLEVREEKIAEIREMVEAGKFPEARKALRKYEAAAENFEKDVSPEERERAKRSASAIYNTLKDIKEDIPEGDREEFFDDVVEKEGKIVTAAEIAGKIKELCETLAEVDPLEYSRVCKTGDDAPEWKKKLDKDLTGQQRAEAEKFGKIMSTCFETSGKNCACEDIPFADLAEMCSLAAPLAVACDVEGNEEACEKLDDLEMPDLPDHLQDVFDNLEEGMMEAQFDMHMPFECVEAGVKSPKECGKIMIQTHAPEECKQALLDSNVQSEREGKEICESIMFDLNAPEECLAAGLTDHKECRKYMFELNSPQECIDAGITGEHRNDPRKCEEIMGGFGEPGGKFGGPRGGYGGNCHDIEDSKKRLDCYDGATREVHSFDDRFRATKEEEKQCAKMCLGEGGAWDFSGGKCKCHFDNFRDDFNERYKEDFDNSRLRSFDDDFYGDESKDGCLGDGGVPITDSRGVFTHCEYRYKKGPPKDIFPSGPPTDRNFGGEGVSCGEGYEGDGQGGCIPFGTGDYGFDNSEEENFDSGSDEGFTEPEQIFEPEQTSEPEPE